jgi:serine/threonine-protein kinase
VTTTDPYGNTVHGSFGSPMIRSPRFVEQRGFRGVGVCTVDESANSRAPVTIIGRYAMSSEIAAGGMATIHIGRLLGPVGFSRTVAIKRLHPQFVKDPEFVAMFLDEARLAARIRHPNVVSPIDVVAAKGELFLVMDYVPGESLGRLTRAARSFGTLVPLSITRSIFSGVLHGLHAAHEARNERGEQLGIVHRDVSPENLLVGVDGVARVLDFGIAKAAGRATTTREGQVKGKIAYMAPESLQQNDLNRKADIYSTAVVLWETLTGDRLFKADTDVQTMARVLTDEVVPPSHLTPWLSPELDAVVLTGLNRDPSKRFETARDMALALEATGPLATPTEVGEWVDRTARAELVGRAELVRRAEHIAFCPTPSNPPAATPSPSRKQVATLFTQSDKRGTRAEEAADGLLPISVSLHPFTVSWGPSRLRKPTPMAGSLCALVLLVAGGFLVAHRSKAVASFTAPVVAVASVAAAPHPTVEPVAAAKPDVPTHNENTTSESRTATATNVATVAPVIASKAPPPRLPRRNWSKPASRPDCDPPYVLDSVGHRHYKVECL